MRRTIPAGKYRDYKCIASYYGRLHLPMHTVVVSLLNPRVPNIWGTRVPFTIEDAVRKSVPV